MREKSKFGTGFLYTILCSDVKVRKILKCSRKPQIDAGSVNLKQNSQKTGTTTATNFYPSLLSKKVKSKHKIGVMESTKAAV